MMRPLLRVERDPEAEAVYLWYSNTKVARQDSLDDHHMFNVDRDAAGEIVGIELLSPRNTEIELLTKFAKENHLSMEGLLASI